MLMRVQKYNNLYKQDAERYTDEYKSVFGRAPQPAQAAAP